MSNKESNIDSNKVSKSLTTIIMYLLFAVLVLGLLAGVMSLMNTVTAANGLYMVYAEDTITQDNSSLGISIEWSTEESEVTFTIGNTEDWGAYTVQDCTVKVVPKVSEENDFEFEVDGDIGLYSLESDLTAAFVSDYKNYAGYGLSVSEDGVFSLYFVPYTSDYLTSCMKTILSRVYGGSDVTIDGECDLLQNVYFAIQITSPDGGTVLTIPVKLYVTSYLIGYTLTNVTSASTNPTMINLGESATLQFTAVGGYILSDEITVTGATLDSWDSSTGIAVISSVTGIVNIVVTAEKYYTINYQLSNVTVDGPSIIRESEVVEIKFMANDGYTLSSDITITGAGSYFWSLIFDSTAYLEIKNPTGDVTVKYSAVAEEKYTLSGVWVFGTTFMNSDISENFSLLSASFTSNGNSYSSMTVAWGYNCVQIAYDSDYVCYQVYGWSDSAYRSIDFGDEEQAVSEVLYNFVTTYAVKGQTYTITVNYDSDQCSVSTSTGYYLISADGTITLYFSALGDYMITYIYIENALVDGVSDDSFYAYSISARFTLSYPVDDVIITVCTADADL